MNEMGEFVDGSESGRVRVRTDAEKRDAALRALVERGVVGLCGVCGAPFRRSDPHRRNAKYCSWECKMEANRRRARERYRRLRHG